MNVLRCSELIRHCTRSCAAVGMFAFGLQNLTTSGAQTLPTAPPPRPLIVGGALPDVELVKQFDANGDKRLDATERRAAQQYIGSKPELRSNPARPGGGRNAGPGTPGRKLAPNEVKSGGAAPLFDAATVRTLFLTFDEPDWEQQMVDFHRTDVELAAKLVVDGKTYQNVGVHFRGNNSFGAVPNGLKRSLTLSFDFVDDAQRVQSYRGLHLLNSNQDPTFLRSVLYMDIARHYLPAMKANFMRVVINGESWGVYVNQQPFDKDYLRDVFGNSDGSRFKSPNNSVGGGLRYLGEDLSAYKRWYEPKGKVDADAWAALIRLTKVLHETPSDRLQQALAPMLNIDGALAFLALDNALINNDGYWNDGSDFNLYLDTKGRFHLLPHDVNEGLRAAGGRGPGRGVQLDPFVAMPDSNKALYGKLLAVPALRAKYLGYIRDIADRWLDWSQLGPMVRTHQALIADDVAADTRKLSATREFTTGVFGEDPSAPPPPSTIKGFADQRRAFLLGLPEVAAARRP